MKPLIGITVGEIQNLLYPWGPVVYGQSYTYVEAIERAGGIPCLIPFMTSVQTLKQLYQKLDGVLIAGGNDINPEMYGEKPYATTVEISDKRDKTETNLIKWAWRDHKPVLAICRGMQMLNVTCGGSLHQHIADDLPEASDHTISTIRQTTADLLAHKLTLQDGSRLAKILATSSLSANSHHHQAIKQLAANLEAVAWAEDGLIEGIESADDWYAVGMQCHPESLEAEAEPIYQKLFESFVAAAASQGRKAQS